MEKLKVGDKLYNKRNERWGGDVYYKFSTVERLTKTQAILSDGTRLINEPKIDWKGLVCYPVYGDTFVKWYFPTEEIFEQAKIENKRQRVNRWFDNKKFTEEEKVIIYTSSSMENKIKQIIADHLEYDLEEVGMESSLQGMGADCLDEVEILMGLEKEFDIRIEDDKFELCKNVSDIVELVKSTKNGN